MASVRTAPNRIRFHGQDVEFSEEIRFLLADEAAGSVLGPSAERPTDPDAPEWKRMLDTALSKFAQAEREPEGYEWLVTPNAELNDERPVELICNGLGGRVLHEVKLHLARTSRIAR